LRIIETMDATSAPLFLCGSPDEAEKLCLRDLDAIDGTAEISMYRFQQLRLRNVIVTPSGHRLAIKNAARLKAMSCTVETMPAGTDLSAPDLLAIPRAPMFPAIVDVSESESMTQGKSGVEIKLDAEAASAAARQRRPLDWTALAASRRSKGDQMNRRQTLAGIGE
jgi:hypothetical protein